MRSTPALTGALLALTVAGCGTSTPDTAAPTQPLTATATLAAAPTTPALPKCGDVFTPGKVIDPAKAKAGCLDPDSIVIIKGGHRCNDGRTLWQVDAASGAAGGWGFGGETYQAQNGSDIAADPAYKKAYNTCRT